MIFFYVTPFSSVDRMQLCNQFTKLHDVKYRRKNIHNHWYTNLKNHIVGPNDRPIKLR